MSLSLWIFDKKTLWLCHKLPDGWSVSWHLRGREVIVRPKKLLVNIQNNPVLFLFCHMFAGKIDGLYEFLVPYHQVWLSKEMLTPIKVEHVSASCRPAGSSKCHWKDSQYQALKVCLLAIPHWTRSTYAMLVWVRRVSLMHLAWWSYGR